MIRPVGETIKTPKPSRVGHSVVHKLSPGPTSGLVRGSRWWHTRHTPSGQPRARVGGMGSGRGRESGTDRAVQGDAGWARWTGQWVGLGTPPSLPEPCPRPPSTVHCGRGRGPSRHPALSSPLGTVRTLLHVSKPFPTTVVGPAQRSGGPTSRTSLGLRPVPVIHTAAWRLPASVRRMPLVLPPSPADTMICVEPRCQHHRESWGSDERPFVRRESLSESATGSKEKEQK